VKGKAEVNEQVKGEGKTNAKEWVKVMICTKMQVNVVRKANTKMEVKVNVRVKAHPKEKAKGNAER
jgi:hypothetical protein